MHFVNSLVVTLLSISAVHIQHASAGFLDGPAFPAPSALSSSPAFQQAAKTFNAALDEVIQKGLEPHDGDQLGTGYALNTTSFSISMFSPTDASPLFERHYTDPLTRNSTYGVRSVRGDTVYRIGSISKLFTVYLLLILNGGDNHLQDPVTDWIPELSTAAPEPGEVPVVTDWSAVTLGDLGSHLAGIARDYAINDVDYKWDASIAAEFGLPPIATSQRATCDYFTASAQYKACSATEFIQGIKNELPYFPVAHTPAYSNNGFSILGIVIERMCGASFGQLLNQHLLSPLGMDQTYYIAPAVTNSSIIPTSPLDSGWNNDVKATGPAYGLYSTANDLALLGSSILNSTFLSQAVTRRWMKPRTFTAKSWEAVGTPWEIVRTQTDSRLVDLYTKDGNWGAYACYLGLIPDYNVGISIMAASLPRPQAQTTTYAIRRLVEKILVPALETIAREQAAATFAGTFRETSTNSSITITTDDMPGLKITQWTSRGHNVLKIQEQILRADAEPAGVDFRLFPNLLSPGSGKVGFTGSCNFLTGPYPAWESVDGFTYGSIGIESFLFEMGNGSSVASTLRPLAWRTQLARVS